MKKLVWALFLFVGFTALGQVGFTSTPASGCGPLDVTFDFTGSPAGIVNLYYDTGDGGELYDQRNATFMYTYTEVGTYTVIMYALDASDEVVDFATGTVTVTGATAGADNTDVPIGDPVNFYVDGDATSVVWDFGDGSATSTEMYPNHVYAAPGIYTVTATIQSTACGTVVSTIEIIISEVNFSINPSVGCAPQDITFTYTGTQDSVAYFYWNFGDGQEDYGPTLSATLHNYSGGGNYLVELFLLDDAFNTVGYVSKTVSLGGISATPSLTITGVGQTIEFTSAGTDGSSISWDFGDGTTSTLLNPTHSYANPGTYDVTLTAISPICGSQTTHTTITITDYTLTTTVTPGCTAPFQIDFEVMGSVAPVYYEWFYGDDSTDFISTATTSHIYQNEGQFYAYVNLYDAAYNYLASLVQVVDLGVGMQVSNPYPSIGENIDFAITGNFTSVSWDFGDGGSSTANTPAYSYATAGTYTVTASIVTPSCGTVTKTQDIVVRDISYSLSSTGGCSPVDVTVTYTGTDPDAVFFDWTFGDNEYDFGPSATVTHTYTQVGTYTMEIVAFNSVFDVLSYKTYQITVTGISGQFDLLIDGSLDVCGSGSAVLTSPVLGSYTWSTGETTPSITVSTDGDYSVSVLNGTCTAESYSETFSINPLPTVNAGADTIGCANFGFTLTLNGSGAATYVWDNGVLDGVNFIPPLDTTVYTVTGTDANGCTNTDQITVISEICGGIGENQLTTMRLYPNPVQELLYVTLSESNLELRVSNILGAILIEQKAGNTNSIDMSALQSGTYFVSALNRNGTVVGVEKVVVQ